MNEPNRLPDELETNADRRSFLPSLSATKVAALLTLFDSVAILACGYVTYDAIVVYSLAQNLYLAAVVFVWISSLSLMNFGDLYNYNAAARPQRNLHRIVVAIATAFLFLLAAAFSVKVSETLSRLWFVYFAAAAMAGVVLLRLLFALALRRLLHVNIAKRSLAIIGAGTQGRRLTAEILKDPHRPLRIHGIFDDTLRPVAHTKDGKAKNIPPAHGLEQLINQARQGLIDDVVIAIPWQEDDRIMAIVSRLRELPVHVYLLSDLIGFRTIFRNPPSHFGALPILQVTAKPMSGWDGWIKQAEDLTLAPILLLVSAPLLLLLALLVKLDSPGPVLFRQKRLGFNNQVFDVYKFRSMQHAALPPGKTQQTTPDDVRVTRVGRFLRRWSLDELPQIFNVLNGTMSLVGPRPHALDHNEEFAARVGDYFARHRVKPGITGLAQVRGYRGATDTDDKLEGRIRNDVFYAENWSLSLDLWILMRTLVICVAGKNAY